MAGSAFVQSLSEPGMMDGIGIAPSLTASLANFAATLTFADIPAPGVDRAVMAIADCIGCVLAGVPTDPARLLMGVLLADGGAPAATVLGTSHRLPASAAALANGTAGHCLDFDDMSPPMLGHPSVVLTPAIFAAAEIADASGSDLVLAYVAGLEVQARLGRLINPAHYEHGWHATMALGVIGASVAAGKLLGLDPAAMRHVVGIAASQAGGLRQNFGSDTKPLHAGLAARGGVFAAQLAKAGFTSNPAILEGARGFLDVFRGGVASRQEPFADPFAPGQDFEIVKSGITIKPYACCGCTHSALDATFDLMAEHAITPGDVAHVECRVNRLAPQVLIHHQASTPTEGKFCVEYCLAVAMLDGAADIKQFTQARVDDPAVQALLRRVDMIVDPSLPVMEGAFPSEVSMQLNDGRTLTKRVVEARGHPTRALRPEELSRKFKGCAEGVLPPAQTDAVFNLLMRLPQLPKATQLAHALAT